MPSHSTIDKKHANWSIPFTDQIGTSLIDIGVALGTAFSVIGVSIGFKMAWGPIWVGVIAAFIGLILGVAIRLVTEVILNKRKRLLKGQQAEVILIIDCVASQGELVENILWEHFAKGVAKVKKTDDRSDADKE